MTKISIISHSANPFMQFVKQIYENTFYLFKFIISYAISIIGNYDKYKQREQRFLVIAPFLFTFLGIDAGKYIF